MRRMILAASAWLLIAGCGAEESPLITGSSIRSKDATTSLSDARRGFETRLVPSEGPRDPVPQPPPRLFRLVRYPSQAGELAAYLSPDPQDGGKHPAIVWITGGDCNSIGEVWGDMPASNDQTARAYRDAGIIMMFPSLRGGNDNPGRKEGFLGEVDDVLAATDYLARQDFVDPGRIYLGGHSTGGTLVLLVAESSDRYRAVFSFGPASDVARYGPQYLPFDTSRTREVQLRSPGHWLHSIRSPTFVFEGTRRGNISALRTMARAATDPRIHFHPVDGADHFSILAPTNALIAGKILRDEGPTTNLQFTAEELSRPFGR